MLSQRSGVIAQDRRGFIRLRKNLVGTFRLLETATLKVSGAAHTCRIANICLGGCKIEVQSLSAQEVGALLSGIHRLSLSIQLESNSDFRTIAAVRWIERTEQGFGLGVCFAECTEEDEQLLRRFIGESLRLLHNTRPRYVSLKTKLRRNLRSYLIILAFVLTALPLSILLSDKLASFADKVSSRLKDLENKVISLEHISPQRAAQYRQLLDRLPPERREQLLQELRQELEQQTPAED